MRTRQLITFLTVVSVGAWLAAAATHARGLTQVDAATMKNPVASDAASLAAGKKLYDNNCAECHGEAGKGDGPRGPYSTPTPPDLTDAQAKHGAADGQIFTVIQNGVKDTDMPAFAKDIPARQTWDVVNYVKSLAAAK